MKVYIVSLLKKENSPYLAVEKKYLLQMKSRFNISIINTAGSIPQDLFKTCSEKSSFNILLNPRGKQFSTEEFYDLYASLEINYKNLFFYIGNDLGCYPQNTPSPSLAISFSNMVFNHFLIRVMLLEQLYRVQCIYTNHPYHQAK